MATSFDTIQKYETKALCKWQERTVRDFREDWKALWLLSLISLAWRFSGRLRFYSPPPQCRNAIRHSFFSFFREILFFFFFLLFECFIKCDRLQEKLTAGGNAKSGGPCFAMQILWSTVWRAKNKKGGKRKSNNRNSFFGSLLYNDVFIQYKLADVKANCIVYATLRRFFFFFFSICISSMSYAPAAEPKGLRGGNDGWAVVFLFFFSCVAHSRSDDDDDDRFGGDRMRMNERMRKRKGNNVNNSPVGWVNEWSVWFFSFPRTLELILGHLATLSVLYCSETCCFFLSFSSLFLSVFLVLFVFYQMPSLVLSYVLEYGRSSNWLFPIPWRMNGLLPHRVALKRRRLIFGFFFFFPFIRP